MARPKVSIFGALFAVGSVLAWKWAQSKRDAQRRAPRDINRWEDEGGKVIAPATLTAAPVTPIRPANANGNGNGALGGTPDAWHFPHS
jgi:hypothetical protein